MMHAAGVQGAALTGPWRGRRGVARVVELVTWGPPGRKGVGVTVVTRGPWSGRPIVGVTMR